MKLFDLEFDIGKEKEWIKPLITKNGFIMDADWSEDDKLIGCVASDSCMYFFGESDKKFE